MKKLKKFFRFIFILIVVTIFFIFICSHLFQFLWNFDIFNSDNYKRVTIYWEKGGVFKTFKDVSLVFSFVLFPILSIIVSFKLYKKGFWKTILYPFYKIYRFFTRPKVTEVEHVSIKNLGAKSRTIDEIISDKIKEKGENTTSQHTIMDIRQQISAKLEENEKQ